MNAFCFRQGRRLALMLSSTIFNKKTKLFTEVLTFNYLLIFWRCCSKEAGVLFETFH